jgi:hypothetical protein
MRMSLWLRCAGMLLVGVVGASSAQSYRSMTTGTPRASGQYYTQPTVVSQPGCGTPVAPPIYGQPLPYASPSMTPGAPYRAPSTATPPAPYTPGNLPPGAAAPAPGAAAAPAAPGAATAPGAAATAAAAAAAGSAAESRGESGSEALSSAAPQMIGDLIGGGLGAVSRSSSGSRLPIVNRSGVKIADNESPRPLDRVFATYNYFNSVGIGGAFTGVHRGLAGFEKTFLDGDASFGMRLPYLWDDNGAGLDGIGMLSAIGKYAFYNDAETGNLASGGLAVAIPLGHSFKLSDGTNLNSVLLQPYAGFIFGVDDFYSHGFTSLIIPTQNNDVLLYTADVGVGYRVFQSNNGDFLRAIIPTVEGHLNVPLNNAGRTELVYFPTLVSITAGSHFLIGDGAWFTLAGGVPITGPNLYDFEVIAQFNYRF